ncbi:MAG: VIT1/CCC1 transporter family protein [Chlamydiales bacterium]|nr:VIT1/CCC1 transporter family protein [Chlamydiales bacterium]
MAKHFENKDALSHVREKRAEGMLSLSEAHGTEMPGHLAAGADAARETAMILLLASIFFPQASLLIPLGFAWFAWKIGRSAWLGWERLERLHRLIEQEKYEIEHHRPQEREELIALYQAKGFEGKLLEDVVDVLMADQDRLLKVMLEEEMGLTLQAFEHPLKQSLGAGVGSLISLIVTIISFFLIPSFGMLIASFLVLTISAAISALYEKNRLIPAVIWNLSIGALSFGVAYFLFQILAKK